MSDKDIEFIQECRQTHVDWAEYLMWHPKYPTNDVGDVAHHRECVEKYDKVLERLADE